ncbi:MAG: efflux RND transporter periplasmic adaptor subunit [Alphaproteobacteria bacterium]|nr:efflux RND transporter periplasmic adaptor subunit [Alphaproteobacteria bacterium]
MKPGLKLTFVTLPLIALGVGILAYIVANRPAPQQNTLAERATAVRVITARNVPLAPKIIGYGLVAPARSYEAIAEVSGPAVYVSPQLEKGKILPEGTVLLRLSDADFSLAIAQARANIRAAKARLAELDISEQNQLAALEIENRALALKQRDLERIKKLTASGASSKVALDGAQSGWLVQRQKVLNLENALALLPTQRQVQTEQIAVYETSLQTAELNLKRATLRLPFAARVAVRSVEVGQFVRVGQITAVLDGIDAAEVEAQVAIADMLALLRSSLPPGQQPVVTPAAMSKFLRDLGLRATVSLRLGKEVLTWPATLARISDTIDQKSGTLGVILRIDTAYSGAEPGKRPPLTKGMFVEATLSAPPLDGIVIPRSALHQGRVWLVDANDRLTSSPVTVQLVQGEVALISAGLAPDQQVVVSMPTPVIEGMLLDVTKDTALEARLAGLGQTK